MEDGASVRAAQGNGPRPGARRGWPKVYFTVDFQAATQLQVDLGGNFVLGSEASKNDRALMRGRGGLFACSGLGG